MSDIVTNDIENIILAEFKRRLGHTTSPSEIQSWKNSLDYMYKILVDVDIPNDAGVSIEYRIPQSTKRIDFILTGKDENHTDTAIIVELKQWTDVKSTTKDAIVRTRLGRGVQETQHPSYQAWSYAALLEDFNETVRDESISLKPCAYLHNCVSNDVINHSFYAEHTKKAPAFLKRDAKRLQAFIKQNVRYGDSDKIMYRIDNGKIRPSKNLADALLSLLQGNQEFLMIDEQKLVYETALHLAKISTETKKKVLIVTGGPGTGKSVVAVNLLVELTSRELVAQYVTKNAAPRAVYESKLAGTFTKTRISNLFKGSGAYTETKGNTFDALIVDEAHRLNAKSGMFQNLGENQIKEIIHSAKCSVFFIDEDQCVTFKDIGRAEEIKRWAKLLGADVQELELQSQFRCNGSNGYLAWLDNALQVRETANQTLEDIDYDFKVFDNPRQLRDAIFTKNSINNKARLVAGYCWKWISKNDATLKDITFVTDDFSMAWNLSDDGSLWILKPDSVNQVGCIHTCQGLEIDYVGVIVGPDLIVRDGRIITDARKRASSDSSVKGYVSLLKQDPELANKKADEIIKNTYRTLMTRGSKGCYLFCVDPETNEYFKTMIGSRSLSQNIQSEIEKYQGLTLRLLPLDEVRPFENAVPIYDLKIAAGGFSESQHIDEIDATHSIESEGYDWVEIPDSFRLQPGLFVTQVAGESMNRRIPNGAWCLFKLNPGGSRQGKVVLARRRDYYDIDTGGQYTVKVYESEKISSSDGTWRHTRIRLRPDSNAFDYKAMEFDEETAGDLIVVAELVAVLG